MKKLKDYVDKYQLTLKHRAEIARRLTEETPEPFKRKVFDEAKEVSLEEMKEIAELQAQYEAHAKLVSKYMQPVRVIGAFYDGAYGYVVRPYANEYNHSVYVRLANDTDMMTPILVDVADLEINEHIKVW